MRRRRRGLVDIDGRAEDARETHVTGVAAADVRAYDGEQVLGEAPAVRAVNVGAAQFGQGLPSCREGTWDGRSVRGEGSWGIIPP